MAVIEPTPSQAAVVLKKFLKSIGVELKLSQAQTAIARTRGYADFQAFVSDVPHRGVASGPHPKNDKPDLIEGGSGTLELWAITGRLYGDDDDTLELIWAKDEGTATEYFEARIRDQNDLPQEDEEGYDESQEDENNQIYVISATRVGAGNAASFVVDAQCQPPAQPQYLTAAELTVEMFDEDTFESSNNSGMLGEFSAETLDGRYKLSATLSMNEPDNSDEDIRAQGELTVTVTYGQNHPQEGKKLACVWFEYEYHSNDPGDHLQEYFESGALLEMLVSSPDR